MSPPSPLATVASYIAIVLRTWLFTIHNTITRSAYRFYDYLTPSKTTNLFYDIYFSGCDAFSFNALNGECVFAPNSPVKNVLAEVSAIEPNWTTFVLKCSEATINALGNDPILDRDIETNCRSVNRRLQLGSIEANCDTDRFIAISGEISSEATRGGLVTFTVKTSTTVPRILSHHMQWRFGNYASGVANLEEGSPS